MTVHLSSDISSGANEAATNGFHETRITKHETRLLGTEALRSFFTAPAGIASGEKNCFSGLVMPDPWLRRKQDSPARRRFLVEQPQAAANGFSRITKHESRNTAFLLFTKHETRNTAISCRAARGALWAGANSEVFTNHDEHESRITAFYAFSVVPMVPVGTEALQSCFFCPGLLGNRTGRREVQSARSRIRASQAFTSHKPLILRPLRNTSTRDTAIACRAARGALWAGANSEVFTKHETRDTNHGFLCFSRGSYGARWY